MGEFLKLLLKSDITKAVIIGTIGVAGSWYDIKSDIKQLKVFQETQIIRDAGQDQSVREMRQDLKDQLKENKNELKQDILDLRKDLRRSNDRQH